MKQLAEMYERAAVVCNTPGQIRESLRQIRGRTSDRRQQLPGFESSREIAKRAGLRPCLPARCEAKPGAVGFSNIQAVANAQGYDVALVFYKKDQTVDLMSEEEQQRERIGDAIYREFRGNRAWKEIAKDYKLTLSETKRLFEAAAVRHKIALQTIKGAQAEYSATVVKDPDRVDRQITNFHKRGVGFQDRETAPPVRKYATPKFS